MKLKYCKVKGCDRKHYAKGYCSLHYYRKRNNIPLRPRCGYCKKILLTKLKWCSVKCAVRFKYHNDKEYREKRLKLGRESSVSIPTFGNKGGSSVYTNGVTQEIKDSGFVEKEKERILKDCIKNPSRYLYDKGKKKNGD